MNKLMYALFISIFFLDYLSLELGLISRYVTWIPDILSLFAMAGVIMLAAMGRDNAISGKYLIFLAIFITHIFLGIALNGVPAGPMVTGIRNTLKFLPFFLLPAVYSFSEIQMKKQLQLLLAIVLFQTPVALYQRLVQYRGNLSGDMISGTTASGSGLLAIICVCAMALLMAFYLKDRIRLPVFCVIIVLLFIPITMGETKASLVFLPLAFIIPVLLMSGKQMPLGKSILLIVLGAVAMIAFFVVYDYFLADRWGGRGLLDFLTVEGIAENYLHTGRSIDDITGGRLGRVDSWVLAWQVISQNFVHLLFGVGVGNVQGSYFGGFVGEYSALAFSYGAKNNSIALFLWEVGLLGVFLYFVLFWLLFADTRKLSRSDGYPGIIALGWSAVVVIMFIALFYKIFFGPNASSYLFWYFSGYVAAERYRLVKRMRQ